MDRRHKKNFLIYSAGGNGREIAWILQTVYRKKSDLKIKYIEDDENKIGKKIDGIDIISYDYAKSKHANWPLINAIGNTYIRKKLFKKALQDGFNFATIMHPSCNISGSNKYGEGCIFYPGVIITINVTIGINCIFNSNVTVGHDSKIGNFVSIAPGSNIAGYVCISDQVYIGAGVSIINGTKDNPIIIGKNAVIGAGAVVIQNVRKDATVVGVPAREINSDIYKKSN